MELHTRFNLNQIVYHIQSLGKEIVDSCPSCKGGTIPLPDGRALKCPRCNGQGMVVVKSVQYFKVSTPMTIGQLRIQVGGKRESDEEIYMCNETGVGSGMGYHGRDLYPDIPSAQEECDKRNNEQGTEWVCVQCNPEYESVQFTGINDWRHCYIHKNNVNHVNKWKAHKLLQERAAERKKPDPEE